MTTLEFMERELNRNIRNLEIQEKRNAPHNDIEHIKVKISHYDRVCKLLRGEE